MLVAAGAMRRRTVCGVGGGEQVVFAERVVALVRIPGVDLFGRRVADLSCAAPMTCPDAPAAELAGAIERLGGALDAARPGEPRRRPSERRAIPGTPRISLRRAGAWGHSRRAPCAPARSPCRGRRAAPAS